MRSDLDDIAAAPASLQGQPQNVPSRRAGGRRGLFIVFEGIDGAGKTTTAQRASATLRHHGLPVTHFSKKTDDFGDAVVRRHALALRRLLWAHDGDDPYYRLGGLHWVYLMAAWFNLLQRHHVQPNLSEDRIVLCDSWIYKFLARLRTKQNVDWDHAAACFAPIIEPDLVIYLDVTPETAAARKVHFTAGEAGNPPTGEEHSKERFLSHQAQLKTVLGGYAERTNWRSISSDRLSLDQTIESVVSLVLGQWSVDRAVRSDSR